MRKAYIPKPEEIPSGICECGCGQATTLAKRTVIKRRHFRGYPLPNIAHHSAVSRAKGADRHNWKGGKHKHPTGYWYIHAPEHPYANGRGYVFEHRLVMEQVLGRYLMPFEVVHHINGIRDDNRPENLVVTTQSEHLREHLPEMHYTPTPEQAREMQRRGIETKRRRKAIKLSE